MMSAADAPSVSGDELPGVIRQARSGKRSASASVPLAWLADTGADAAKLNPRGGAIALGHALGSSGTRLRTTLVNQLEATGGRYGLQTMCEGAGMANATIIERL